MKSYSKQQQQQQQYPSSRQGTFSSKRIYYVPIDASSSSSASSSSRNGKFIKEQFEESPMGRIKKYTDVLPEDISMVEIKYNVELISKLTNTDYLIVLTDMILQICKKIPKMSGKMLSFITKIEPLISETLHSVSKINLDKKQLVNDKQFDYVNKMLYVKPEKKDEQEFVQAIRLMINITKCDLKVPNGKGETLLQAYNFACSESYAKICAKKSGTLGKSYILEPIVKIQEIVEILSGLDNITRNLNYAANLIAPENHTKYIELFDLSMKHKKSHIVDEFVKRVQGTKFATENNYCINIELLVNVWKMTLGDHWPEFVDLYIDKVCQSITFGRDAFGSDAFDKSIKPYIAIGSMIELNNGKFEQLLNVMHIDITNDLCKKGLIYMTTQYLKKVKDKQQLYDTVIKQHIYLIDKQKNIKQITELCNILISIVFNDKKMTLDKAKKMKPKNQASAHKSFNLWSALDVPDDPDDDELEQVVSELSASTSEDNLSLDTVEPYEFNLNENCSPIFMGLPLETILTTELKETWQKKMREQDDIPNSINSAIYSLFDEIILVSDIQVLEKQTFFKNLIDSIFKKDVVNNAIKKFIEFSNQDGNMIEDMWSSKHSLDNYMSFVKMYQ
uniref:Uncharacterized protein n=1 Tax=viral metagenome TaxID=1070528 RepID=A0A6C0BEN9_9ZZZZ